MNERQLYYFIIAAEERNLGRAAEKLPLSLSALSRQIQSLEEELGTTLFIRTMSGVELTSAGETLLRHARALRSQFELVKNDIQQAATAIKNKINIGGHGSSMLNHIPNIIKLFHEAHPEIEVALHSAQITQQFDNLRNGHIQIAFDRHFSHPSDLSVELAYEESICVALHVDHPLARMEKIFFKDLRNTPIIGRLKNDLTQDWIELIKQHKFEPIIIQKTQDMASAVSMVSAGLGIAFAPESFQNLPIPNVTYRPFIAELDLQCNLFCYYRNNDESKILQQMLETVRTYRKMKK